MRSSVVFAGALVLLLFVLGLESLEPLSQEIDRPSRTDALPVERGPLYAAHLMAPAGLLAVAGLIGATAASVFEPRLTPAAFALAVPTVWAGATGAVVTTVSDAPPLPENADITLTGRDKSDQSMTIPPEFAGFATTFAVLVPLLISTVAAVPLLILRISFDGAGTDPVGGVVRSNIGLLLAVAAVVAWVVWRDRIRTRVRKFFLEGREQYAASGGRLT